MADLHRLVAPDELKTTLLKKLESGEIHSEPRIHYDEDVDMIVLLALRPQGDVIVHYVDEHVGLLYEADSLEIVGLQVENFDYSFVPKHQDIQNTWTLTGALGKPYKNLGEMKLSIRRREFELAREVVRATPEAPKELEAAFAA